MAEDRKFDTAYLHVGLGKTGTTSIQQQLLQHAELLESRYGLHFPRKFPHEHRFNGNHSLLIRALYPESDAARKRLAGLGLTSRRKIERYNQKTLAQLTRGFARTSASSLLLSAEGVGHFSAEDTHALARWLAGLANEIRIIVCVRHPLDALSSEIQQRLNLGAVLEDLYRSPPYYRFRSLFERLESAFGPNNIIAYSFNDAVNHPGGVTAMFLSQLGIEDPAVFTREPPANTSMSHEAALLISALNRQRPLLDENGRNPLRRSDDIRQIKSIPGRRYTAPAEVYERVRHAMQQDVEWLRKSYRVELRAAHVEESMDHDSFSEESRDYIALTLSDYARTRYILFSPPRLAYLYARRLLAKIFS
jgi:hypothetical protein